MWVYYVYYSNNRLEGCILLVVLFTHHYASYSKVFILVRYIIHNILRCATAATPLCPPSLLER